MRNRILVSIIFVLIIGSVHAQHTISGLVTNKKDNAHLIDDVAVFIPEFDRIDYSREGGTYILRNIGIGMIHIQFSKKGFKTIVKTVSTTDSATVLNVEMELHGSDGREATSAEFQSTLPENSPFIISQFNADKLRRMGNPKLLTSLSYEPGIDMITIGQISKPVIRGMSGSNILMIQSGTRIESNSLDQRYDYELIDDGTSTIEIVKGPASLMYGDYSAGGVLIFKDEKFAPLGTVSGDAGVAFYANTLGLKTDAGIKGTSSAGNFYSLRFGAASHTSYVQGEGFELKKNTELRKFAYNSGFASGNVKGIIGISRKWGESKVTLAFWKKQSELTQSLTETQIENLVGNRERNRTSDQPFIGQQSLLVSSENTLLIKNAKLNVNLSWQSYEREASYTAGSVNYDVRYTTNPERKSGLIAGTQGYFQAKDYKAYISIYQNRVFSNSFYVLYRYDLEKLNVLAGVRYDNKKVTTPVEALDKDYQSVNGSAGIAWHPVDYLTIKLNAASGNSIPAEERFFSNYLYYGYLYAYDTKEIRNYEGDMEAEWSHPSVTVTVNGFYNCIYNFSYVDTFDLFPAGAGDQYILSQGDANITGGEAKLVIHPQSLNWLNLRVGYSIVRGKFDATDADLPLMPADKLTAAIRFQSNQMKSMYRPYLDIIFRNYMKQEKVFHEMPTDAYSLIDLHVGGSFKWGKQLFDISIAANNILDKDYYSHLSMLKNLTPEPVRDVGRNVAILFRFPFGLKH